MANIRTLTRSFAGGELTPEFFGQIADAKFQTGLAKCRNFVVLPHGPVQNRAGFAFVRAAKISEQRVRLLPFTFSTTQTMVLEFGAQYIRFHTQGATLVDGGGNPYEVATPYAADDLFDIHYVQSADVLTLVHPKYAPRELRRLGALNWTLTTIQFATNLNPPTGLTSVATLGANPGTLIEHTYAVTTVDSTGLDESLLSDPTTCSNNLFATGAYNTVNWNLAAGGTRYNVYKKSNGVWGYMGQADGGTFKDDNITPDISRTPPERSDPFTAGQLQSVPVVNGGSGYGTAQSGGAFISVAVLNGGNTYTAPTIAVSDPTGSGAVLTPILGPSGAITSVTVTAPGSGYTSPTLIISDNAVEGGEGSIGGTGSGAVLSANLSPIVRGTATLTVTDAGGTGSGAVVTPVIVNGSITSVSILNPGRAYTAPVVTITDAGGGTGAVFGAPVISSGDFPGAVTYYEQRRAFGGTLNKPQNLWLTRSGTESNMSYSIPTRDSDAINFRVVAREANTVRHLVPLNSLLALTSSAEWRVGAINTDALTPTSVSVKPQSYIGANNVQPVVVNNNLIYAAARGGHIRELAFNNDAGGYLTGDMSLRAPHLFDGLDIVDMALAKAPSPVIWMVSSDGRLVAVTYVPEQQIGAWHQHDTPGAFESVAAVAEGDEDAVYVVARRTINGQSVRYIERLHSRRFVAQRDAFFVDSGLTYDGAETSTITGLAHLENQRVSILADGAVHPPRVVTGGTITLDNPASVVHVGLPIIGDLESLPMAFEVQGYGQGRTKNVNKMFIRVFNSGGIKAGPDYSKLVEAKQRTVEPYGSPPLLKTKEIEIVVTPSWDDSGRMCIRQEDPLPLTVLSICYEVAVGG